MSIPILYLKNAFFAIVYSIWLLGIFTIQDFGLTVLAILPPFGFAFGFVYLFSGIATVFWICFLIILFGYFFHYFNALN